MQTFAHNFTKRLINEAHSLSRLLIGFESVLCIEPNVMDFMILTGIFKAANR